MRKSCPSWGSKLKKTFPSFALSIKQPPRSGMSSAGYPKLNASVCQNCCIGRKKIPLNESPLLNIIQHQFSLLGKIITENWLKLFNQNRGKEHSLTELALSWSQCPRRGMSSERASSGEWQTVWLESSHPRSVHRESSLRLGSKTPFCCLLQSPDSPAPHLGLLSLLLVRSASRMPDKEFPSLPVNNR